MTPSMTLNPDLFVSSQVFAVREMFSDTHFPSEPFPHTISSPLTDGAEGGFGFAADDG
jgi:hypothetical protein